MHFSFCKGETFRITCLRVPRLLTPQDGPNSGPANIASSLPSRTCATGSEHLGTNTKHTHTLKHTIYVCVCVCVCKLPSHTQFLLLTNHKLFDSFINYSFHFSPRTLTIFGSCIVKLQPFFTRLQTHSLILS